ncbi:MAG: NAD-dependent epimerase/dehydratase family protein [Candidatus Sungbacteria bacterium]|nr:NAD-dependent epimerase/dehydratase family protein [Candidatus Sungbacteria bacterium]
MKYIVTGGAGFIGSHIADMLVERGDEVHVVDNFLTGKRERVNPRAVLHEVDIRDFEKLAPIFRKAAGIFHTAAQPRMQLSIREPRLTNDINITGTLNVLLAARDAGVKRVVYSASSSAYGHRKEMPLREDMPPLPVIPYAIQKHVGERYCEMVSRFYGLETVSLRYFNVYGPRQATDADGPYATVIGIFLGEREKGLPMTIVPDGSQRRDFTHVSDVARANLLAMGSEMVGKGEIINIGCGKNYSMLEVADMIGGPKVFVEPRQGEAPETLADNRKARELLNWEPQISFEQGVAELKKMHHIV